MKKIIELINSVLNHSQPRNEKNFTKNPLKSDELIDFFFPFFPRFSLKRFEKVFTHNFFSIFTRLYFRNFNGVK